MEVHQNPSNDDAKSQSGQDSALSIAEHQILLDRTTMRGTVAASQRGKGHDCCVDFDGLQITD